MARMDCIARVGWQLRSHSILFSGTSLVKSMAQSNIAITKPRTEFLPMLPSRGPMRKGTDYTDRADILR